MSDGPNGDLVEGFRAVTGALAALAGPDRAVGTTAPPTSEAVPVTVLTGFLGSGKTTVLRHALTGDHGLRLSAIVNDLAAVNIDAQLLATVGRGDGRPDIDPGREVALSNGCACCQLDGELIDALDRLAGHGAAEGYDPAPDAIIIEASGTSDAVSIASIIEARPGVRLDGIVCVVDAVAWAEQSAHPIAGRIARRQLEAAHLALLTKVDLVSVEQVRAVTASIAEAAPGRRVVPTWNGRVEPAVLFAAAVQGAALRPPREIHGIGLATDCVEVGYRVDLGAVARWLERGDHGLLRAKGWIDADDGRCHELQVVGRRWTLTPLSAGRPSAVVVLIAETEAVLLAAAESLQACRSAGPAGQTTGEPPD